MKLDIFSYRDLTHPSVESRKKIEAALLQYGIVGFRGVPEFEELSRAYIDALRQFSALPEATKCQYAPDRDTGDTEGYELGAEKFKDQNGDWKIDDKKTSYYAFVPDRACNKWPREVDLKTHYLALAQRVFDTSRLLLESLGIDESIGVDLDRLSGHGRMLHYRIENDSTHTNRDWCGAHLDHGLLTGLVPAYYFRDGKEVAEPEEAGLCIVPTNGSEFVKVGAIDKSILLFQVGEFGQLISHDRIKATRHLVKKAKGGIERFALAVFTDPQFEYAVKSHSVLAEDGRYTENQATDGSITYRRWHEASYDRYRAV